jgi:hypothetical protein
MRRVDERKHVILPKGVKVETRALLCVRVISVVEC